eukprot:6203094-Pleurochrysis_carterae.AAC.2
MAAASPSPAGAPCACPSQRGPWAPGRRTARRGGVRTSDRIFRRLGGGRPSCAAEATTPR